MPSKEARVRALGVLGARGWLLALAVSLPAAAAAPPWEGAPFAGAPVDIARAAAAVPPDPGESVVVLLSDATYSYDAAGRETFTRRTVYRIVNSGAHESWAAIEERWSPWHQDRPQVRARVMTADGLSHPLDPAVLAENGVSGAAPDQFEDDKVLRGPLPAAGPGAVVEEEVTVRDTQPFFDAGVVRYYGLQAAVATRRARLTLDAPSGLPLSWVVRGLPGLAPRETVAGGRRRLVFEAEDVAAVSAPEPGLAPDVPATAYVAFSTGGSWNAVARRYSEIVDQALAGAELSGFVRAAGPAGASQVETIDRLLGKIGGEVRYTGLELGAGGLIPRRPAETLQRKFGDCKDKAVLLVALLSALDVPAYVALLSAGEGEADVEATLPGMGAFNHAIVMVPGNPPLWIDPTDRFARAGELPVADQGRLALVASPSATALVRTPEAAAHDNREVERREVTLAELGKGRLVETAEYYGAAERELRAYYAAGDPAELRDNLAEYVKDVYRAEEVTDVATSDPTDLSRPFSIRLTAGKIGSALTDVGEAVVAIDLMALLDRLPEELLADPADEEDSEPRTADYVFTRPFVVEEIFHIVAPAGFAAQPLPPSRTRPLGSATLSEEYAVEPGGAVAARVVFDSGKRRLTAAELAALQTALGEVKKERMVFVKFDQVGESLLAAGRVPEALAELERLARAAPKKALSRARVARALLAGGMAEAARREARRAVELEPDLVQAWRDLGWILEHDEMGRHRQPGFDLAGAVAAYRKAVALAPDDAVARASLAILLEHNALGERYGRGADLPAAITEYKAVAFDELASELQPNLLIALLRAGRPEEVKTEAARLADSSTRRILEVVATAMTGGAEAALAEAERKFPEPGERVSALASAAQNLASLRRYGEASALLSRAGRQAPKPAELLARAELLAKVRPAGPAGPEAENTPVGVVRAAFLTLFSAPFDPAALLRYFSSEATAEAGPADHETLEKAFVESFGPMRRSLRAGELSLDVARDLFMALVTERVEGNDETGYRIRLEAPFVDDDDLVVFVVREGDRYRIALGGSDRELIGTMALARAQKGELAAARQWLDWGVAGLRSGNDDDPLGKAPVLSLWTVGKEAPLEVARCAAAALAADGPAAAAVLAVLDACRSAATETARQVALDVARARAHEALGRWDDLLGEARRLRAAYPASELAFLYECEALRKLGRLPELDAAAQARLAEKPGDPLALRMLSGLAQSLGKLDQAEGFLQQLTDGAEALSLDFNNRAWLALMRGQADEQAAEWARKATTLSGYQDESSLHTLAAIYAEQGKTAEAYRVLIESLAAKADERPEPHDWYVLGRLAEHYGLADEARRYYRMVPPEPDPAEVASSTWALASRRLAALGKK